MTQLYKPVHPVRFVTAASLFDGHDAAINIMRRLLQAQGAEVIHLGHNRSVDEVVKAAIAEDVQGVAISSYQGGHMEYFRYLVDRLRAEDRGDIRIYGGGGGVIVTSEIEELEAYGVQRIFSPADGQRLGLDAMINLLIQECDRDLAADPSPPLDSVEAGDHRALARWISCIEAGALDQDDADALRSRFGQHPVPVLGITGTGGSGKSSLTDELVRRFRLDQEDKLAIAVLAVDPTRRRGGGALLGDRIRMNAIDAPNVYFRSMATRGSSSELPDRFPLVVAACRGSRIRPGHRRDPRDRPGRRRRHRDRRCLALRHDARVRCCLPAREDRHARTGRRGGHQQIRPPGRRRRLPPGVPAVGPRPSGRHGDRGRRARVRDHRLPFQRRRRHCAVPPAQGPAGRRGPGGHRRGAGSGGRSTVHPDVGHRPGQPPPLPGRDRRNSPGLPRHHGPPGRRGPPGRAGGRSDIPGPGARGRHR